MVWGRARKDKALAARFVAALNAHDVDALAALVTDDFVYIDTWREGIVGRDNGVAMVSALFALDPEFALVVERTSFREPYVLMRGKVISGQPGVGRRAVWRARCEGDRLAEWQAWADGRPPAFSRAFAPDAARDLSDRAADRPDYD